MDSCVRGYHFYDKIRTAVLGEVHLLKAQLDQEKVLYA